MKYKNTECLYGSKKYKKKLIYKIINKFTLIMTQENDLVLLLLICIPILVIILIREIEYLTNNRLYEIGNLIIIMVVTYVLHICVYRVYQEL